MNSITHNNFARISLMAFCVFAMASLSFGIAAKAHADGDSIDADYGYYSGDDSGLDADYSYYPATDSGLDADYSYYPASDSGLDADYGYYSASTPASYYSTPTSYYGGTGYVSGGYGFGYSGAPIGGGSTYAPTTVTDTSSVYAPTQTNTCTAPNTCNTSTNVSSPTTVTIDNAGSGGSYPVYTPVYQPTYTPPCSTCNCYGPCAVNTVIPTVPTYPAPTPYVSLTAVPYTGLDLGPVGTALYWSFLVLWCLAAAYLIIVKRVQNKVVKWLNNFLFGASAPAPLAIAGAAHGHAHVAPVAHNAPVVEEEDTIDPFIASQINRAK